MTAFPAFDPDYAAHLALMHAIEQHGLWPLPYHGIIGSHLLTLALRYVLATSLTGAMLITFISAWLVAAAALVRDWRSLAVVIGFSTPLVLHMASHGFYPQVISLAPYAWALRAQHDGRYGRAAILTLLGACFYPDCAMFLLPAIAWQARRGRVLALLVSAALFAGQAQELHHDGAALRSWTPQALFAGALLATNARMRATLVAFGAIVLGMIALSLLTQGSVTYYARKNLYALVLLAPFASRYALLPLLAYVAFSLTPQARVPLWQWHAPSFDARAEACARQFAGLCQSPAIIPPPGAAWERAQQVLGFAAFVGGSSTDPFDPQVSAANDCIVSQDSQSASSQCPPWYLAPRPLSP